MSTATLINVATEITNLTAGVGHKTNIPPLPELSPSIVSAAVQADGDFWVSHKKILKAFRAALEGTDFTLPTDEDDENLALWFIIDKRLRPGMSIRNKDLADGIKFTIDKNNRRGPHMGVLVTTKEV